MGCILHANAKTTPRIRKEIQESKESINALAKRLHLNPKTVSKWKKAERITDNPSGAKKVNSVLNEVEQQIICEFRRVTRLSLDDIFISLKPKIPALTRSNLHRCLKRNGLNVLPKEENTEKNKKKKFKDYQIGFVHIDITEVRVQKMKFQLFVGIDRVSKYVYLEIHDNKTIKTTISFLENLIKECPFKIHKILTDNGSQFTYSAMPVKTDKIHPFDKLCSENNIEHRLTKYFHPWTNGQVEIMNKIIKDHTVKNYYYENLKELKHHLMSFVLYYNFQRPLKSLKLKKPYEIIIEWYEKDKNLFKENPHQKLLGLNNYIRLINGKKDYIPFLNYFYH
jgi:transposase-like protein